MFKASNISNPTADPTLVQIDEQSVAHLTDGTKLSFPEGTKFRTQPYPEDIKLVLVVTPPPRSGAQPMEFKIIQGATRSNVEAAIRQCR